MVAFLKYTRFYIFLEQENKDFKENTQLIQGKYEKFDLYYRKNIAVRQVSGLYHIHTEENPYEIRIR